MARLFFNVPFFRPASDARLSELPLSGDAVAQPHGRLDPSGWHDSGAGGWYESSHDLRAGVSVSEWGSLDDLDDFQIRT